MKAFEDLRLKETSFSFLTKEKQSHSWLNRNETITSCFEQDYLKININLLVFSNDSQTNSDKKEPNIEEEESSNDDLKPKQRKKKSGSRKAAVKQEQVEDDDHGTISFKLINLVFMSLPLIVIYNLISPVQRTLHS